jgi:CDP-4-dehydro-6-deoxyglucose reductase
MVEIRFGEHTVLLNEGESVLDGCLRNGLHIPHGCKSGACQSCMLIADEGNIPVTAQKGLKNTEKDLRYFLSCQCIPQNTLHIRQANQMQDIQHSRVLAHGLINKNVLQLRLEPVFTYKPGQYLNIWQKVDNEKTECVRSYSIASVPEIDDFIELHIKIIDSGKFSQWAKNHLRIGDTLQLQGPLGQCFYAAENPEQPLLLIGVGTGLAPLIGIARDALQKGHSGKIDLIHAAREAHSFYLQNELGNLVRDYPQFNITYVCQADDQTAASASPYRVNGDVYAYVKQHFPSTKGMKVYVCGAASFVRKISKQVFLSGASSRDIHADSFLPCS